jgi:hypothetical protein
LLRRSPTGRVKDDRQSVKSCRFEFFKHDSSGDPRDPLKLRGPLTLL